MSVIPSGTIGNLETIYEASLVIPYVIIYSISIKSRMFYTSKVDISDTFDVLTLVEPANAVRRFQRNSLQACDCCMMFENKRMKLGCSYYNAILIIKMSIQNK